MSRYRQKPEPAPFFWIALEKEPSRRRLDGHAFHDAFHGWTGWLDLEIEVFSDYLYVGSGQIDLVRIEGREQARYTFTRRDGKLVIPATSIKGAVRSVFEAITNSCVPIVAKEIRRKGKIIKPDERPLFRKRARYAAWRACCSITNLCAACRVFGTTKYRGRVHFIDAEPVGKIQTITIKIADLWTPRRVQGSRKFYETKSFQKQDLRPESNTRFIEVTPKGSKFHTALRFENLSVAELGALMRALGLDPHNVESNAFPLKLGGAKPRCLGSVYFRPKRVRIIASPQQSWLQGLLQPSGQEQPVSTLAIWLQDTTLVDMEAWEKFRAHAQPKMDKSCPKGAY